MASASPVQRALPGRMARLAPKARLGQRPTLPPIPAKTATSDLRVQQELQGLLVLQEHRARSVPRPILLLIKVRMAIPVPRESRALQALQGLRELAALLALPCS